MQALFAPPHWRAVDLLSDLHLSASLPLTTRAFIDHLHNTEADAVIVLGDLFEVWIGDEQRYQPLERECLQALQTASKRCFVGFMAGNRDFLLGAAALHAAGAAFLPDPLPVRGFGRGLLLSHGDALCLADTDYQAFRREVRSPAWQAEFLSRPVEERRRLAQHIRQESQQRKASRPDASDWADVDTQAARAALIEAHASLLIHGHTHQPGEHALGDGLRRAVLSDWDLDGKPPRAEVLRLTRDGEQRMAPRAARAVSGGP